MKIKFILFFSIIFAMIVYAQDSLIAKREYTAIRLSGKAPKIDGRLDDVWNSGHWESDFTQIDPVEGVPPTELSKFKILYDKKNLYIAIIAYDSQPNLITRLLSRRDNIKDSDAFFVGIDSYHDRRTAFYFGLNVSGVRSDFIMSDDGESHDENWDPIWTGKTSVNDSGWIAEYRIPFSQLRFSEAPEQIWGFQINRRIHRKQEKSSWQYIPKDANGLVSFFGVLQGIKNIKLPSRVEFLPYALAGLNAYEAEEGNPFLSGRDYRLNAGLDGKIGLTSNLNIDFTVNPDFGQVEADPSNVNLSAFEIFFEERRPFFIEGKNIFSFPIFAGDDESEESLFYSRRIGRKPHYEPDEDDGYPSDYIDMPDQSRIIGAAKLSGKTSNGWSIGVLDAVTKREFADVRYNDQNYKVAAEPLTNFLVGRLQKDFQAGNTSLGGIVTATNRKIEDDHLNFLNKSAYTSGLDFRHQWGNKSFFVQAKIFGSHVAGLPEAITRLQESSSRYFQRPDNNYTHYDSTRISLSGHGGSLNIGKSGNGHWDYGVGGSWRSPELELNDLGYMRFSDFLISYAWLGYSQRNPIGIFRQYTIQMGEWQGWNFGGNRTALGWHLSGETKFMNYWEVNARTNRNAASYSSHLLRGGPLARVEGGWSNFIKIGSDDRKDIEIGARYSLNISDNEISTMNHFGVYLSYKVNSKIRIIIRPSASYRVEDLQYIDTIELENMEDDKRYIFGEIDQKTFGLIFRLNYSPTPDVSLQYYGQPFFSSGNYDNFKHINNPRGIKSDRYHLYTDSEISYDSQTETYRVQEDAPGSSSYYFDKPDYNIMEFLSNLVFRWEYRPGSTLYLVWSQFRDQDDLFYSSDLSGSFQSLFRTHPENMFIIKMNYWFSL